MRRLPCRLQVLSSLRAYEFFFDVRGLFVVRWSGIPRLRSPHLVPSEEPLDPKVTRVIVVIIRYGVPLDGPRCFILVIGFASSDLFLLATSGFLHWQFPRRTHAEAGF